MVWSIDTLKVRGTVRSKDKAASLVKRFEQKFGKGAFEVVAA